MSDSLETIVLTCRSGTVPRVVAALKGLFGRRDDVLGCWTTDIGCLNEIVLLARDSLFEVLSSAVLPELERIDRTLWTLHGDIVPQLEGACTVWEWRVYEILPGREEEAVQIMQSALSKRVTISPLYALMTSQTGRSRLCHIWPYADATDRTERRKDALATGCWPPGDIYQTIGTMRNAILSPVVLSS